MTCNKIRLVLISVSKRSLKKTFNYCTIQGDEFSDALRHKNEKTYKFLNEEKIHSALRVSVIKQVTINYFFIIIVQ